MTRVKIVVAFLLSFPAQEATTYCGEAAGPIKITDGLFDQSQRETLGLPTIPGEHETLYRATEDNYKFCHGPNAGVFQDRLYVMWSNGIQHEDHNGQRILYCSSSDGVAWSKPTVLVPDADGLDGPLRCIASGFHTTGDKLIAYHTAVRQERPAHDLDHIHYQTSQDGQHWSEPRPMVKGSSLEGPRPLPSGRLLLTGRRAGRQPLVMVSDDSDGISGWTYAEIAPSDVSTPYPEPSWFRRPDGTLVMLFRTTRSKPGSWLYASTSRDEGRTWSRLEETNFPDAESRMGAGNLPDGRVYIINNPSHGENSVYTFLGRRNPMTIALSDDGVTFDRAYVIRSEDTTMRFPGENKLPGWQYPAAVIWRDHLYVVYSVNKEDIGVTRIPLSDL